MHVHLIGIGGTGLSAIAQVLTQKGYEVSGSDRFETAVTQTLRQQGIQVFVGHQPVNVRGADLVLRSSAVSGENVEILEAQRLGIPVLKRSEILERMIAGQECVAVAGTHGKTTTTAMLAWVLHALDTDPSYLIGSSSFNLGSNAHAGSGRFFVIEADEYDNMFLGLRPKVAVVTNIEHDHPDFFPTYGDVLRAFETFASQILRSGMLIASGEDAGAAQLLDFASQKGLRCVSFGLGAGAFDLCATELEVSDSGGYRFHVSGRGGASFAQITLRVPGLHNVRNALACMAVVLSLDLPPDLAAAALQNFQGTARRFELVGEVSGVAVVSDYAHHPSEIRATLSAARGRYPGRRIWAIWQPHTFSRTRILLDQFSSSFEAADRVIVTEVYAAREDKPTDGFSAGAIAAHIPGNVEYLPGLEQVRSYLEAHLATGDVVIILSAGDADKLGNWVLTDLAEKNV